jgi:hypothetical protein
VRTQHRPFQPASWLGRAAVGGALVALLAGGTIAPVAAQPGPPDVRTIQVTGTGAATAPAETARIQISLVRYVDFGMNPMMPMDPMMPMAPPAEVVEVEVDVVDGTPPSAPEPVMSEPAVTTGMMPTVPITPEDLAPVLDALVAAGAPEDATTVNTGPGIGGYFGPGAPGYALIEIMLPDPTVESVKAIIMAASDEVAGGPISVEQVGVEYNVADCAPLIEAAQAAAFADARSRAESLAQHIGASVGAPVQVSDFGMTQMPFIGGSGCPPTPDMGYGIYGPMPAFNTPTFSELNPAEARALVQLSVSYEYELASQ